MKTDGPVCRECGECCQWIAIDTAYDPTPDNLEYFKTRGVKTFIINGKIVMEVQQKCTHHSVGGCMIYDKRPRVCRDYHCRRDKHAEEVD